MATTEAPKYDIKLASTWMCGNPIAKGIQYAGTALQTINSKDNTSGGT